MFRRVPLALVLCCLAGSTARADFFFEQTGDVVREGSWAAPIAFFSTTSSIDSLAARITTGSDPFSPQAITDFSVGGWSQTSNQGMIATATGSGTGMLGFTLHFSGSFTEPLQFDVAAFSNGEYIGSLHGVWSGNGHFVALSDGTWQPDTSIFGSGGVHAPSPSSLLLGMIGMGLIGMVRFRFL